MDSDDGGDGATQRRSGRVVRPPTKYLDDGAPQTTKRKRIGEDGQDLGDDADGLEGLDGLDGLENEPSDDDDGDDANDGDHMDGEARRAASRSKRRNGAAAAKRATKKPKLNGANGDANHGNGSNGSNGNGSGNGNSHAANLPSRPKKSVRVTIETDGDHGSELYADIFQSGDDSDDVAARWYERYQTNNQAAVADLVNCILSAAGCDYHVTEDDINDPDNCSNRLTELQGYYEDVSTT